MLLTRYSLSLASHFGLLVRYFGLLACYFSVLARYFALLSLTCQLRWLTFLTCGLRLLTLLTYRLLPLAYCRYTCQAQYYNVGGLAEYHLRAKDSFGLTGKGIEHSTYIFEY